MKFLVVVPSVRQSYPGFDAAMERIRDSLTMPTEFHVLDGHEGKAQTLNRALTEILPATDAEIYVTMDDDFIPSLGWQDKVAQAFAIFPKLGSVGLWLGDDPQMLDYMGAKHIGRPRKVDGVTLRLIRTGHHVVGCNVAMRRHVALKIGPTPDSSEKYQFWEDGWRGRMVTKLKYQQGFIDAGPVEFIGWEDTKCYLESRGRDIESAQGKVAEIMRRSGVGPSIAERFRAKITRLVKRK